LEPLENISVCIQPLRWYTAVLPGGASPSSSLFSVARGNTNIVGTKLPKHSWKSQHCLMHPSPKDKPPTCLSAQSKHFNLLIGYGRNPSFINILNAFWIEVVFVIPRR
jgi:hypothetical protein